MSTRPRVVRTKRDSFEKGNSKEHKETEGSFDTFAVSLKAVFKGTKRGISPIWNIYKESFFERLKKGGNVGDFSHVLEEKRGCLTLSPFFGQFKGFLKVDRKPASRDHFIHFEG